MVRSGQWTTKLKNIPKPAMAGRRDRGAKLAGEWRIKPSRREEQLRTPIPVISANWEAEAATRILDSLRQRMGRPES